MCHRPLCSEEVGIDRQGRERIFPNEPEIAVHWAEHSEHAALLHPMQLAPEIFLSEHVGQLKLRFELFRWRKQSQLDVSRAERMHRERIQRELNATSFSQLSMKFLLGRFSSARAAQIKS